MRTAMDILLAEDLDEDAELALRALRRAAPQLRVLRVKDGDQALQFLFETGGYWVVLEVCLGSSCSTCRCQKPMGCKR